MQPAPVRWLGFEPASPARNMAVDRALLHGARTPAIRLYAWTPPGVSLGWFQRDVDTAPFRAAGYEVVRRLTGGGAVVHHHEVTYAVVLPLSHAAMAGASVVDSYRAIHAPIREALAALGVDAGEDGAAALPRHAREPVLCFERASPFDVVVLGRKVVGAAQRRLPGRLLQHGSIVLEPNPLQPCQPSLSAVAGRAISATDLAEALRRAFDRAFGPLVAATLDPHEEAMAGAAG
jgi:lipoate-protein ligase A